MAQRSDFSEQEWEALHKGVTGAALLVSVSDRSFFDSFKEAGVLAKHLAAARKEGSSQLIRELSEERGTGFGMTSSPDEVDNGTIEGTRHRCLDPRG